MFCHLVNIYILSNFFTYWRLLLKFPSKTLHFRNLGSILTSVWNEFVFQYVNFCGTWILVGAAAIAVNSFKNTCKLNTYIARNTEKNIYLFIFEGNCHQWKYFFRFITGLWVWRELFVTAILCFFFEVNSVLTCGMIIDIYMVWAMRPACSKWIQTDQK